MLRIELLIDAGRTSSAKGPLWDVAEQRLYWIDSLRPGGASLRRARPGVAELARARAYRLDGAARAAAAPSVALRNGFHLLDFDTGEVQLIADPEPGKPRTRLNDGKVDRQGRFVAGSHGLRGARAARQAVPPRSRPVAAHSSTSGIICSNGPCWSPDGRTFYFADT